MSLSFAHLTPADVAAARALHPRAVAPSLLSRVAPWAIAAAALGYLIWLGARFGLTPERFVLGLSKLGGAILDMFPPSPGDVLVPILVATAQTLAMAFLGTLIAAVVAFPLGLLGAKTVVSNPVAHFLIRRVFDVFRAIPALIWALIFVRAVGLGPLAGVLALAMSDFAPLAKLNAEAIENADRRPMEGVTSAGASRLLVLRFGLLPQVLPIQMSQALYFFESNVRSAAILGIVGAGGIGQELSESIRLFNWNEVAFILIVFLVLVAIIDQISKAIRQAIIGKRS